MLVLLVGGLFRAFRGTAPFSVQAEHGEARPVCHLPFSRGI